MLCSTDITYSLFQSLAFRMDAEAAHELSIDTLSKFPKLSALPFGQQTIPERFQLKVGELVWPFPVGLAAGLDKNAAAIDFFSRLYFGAIEVGTITPFAQPGNERPRLFRIKEHESLRNQMGFNNEGTEVARQNILRSDRRGRLLGINLGKNKNTPDESANEDYRKLYQSFHDLADYLVINVSSPNTPGLRKLQGKAELEKILSVLSDLRQNHPRPLYVKISPDLNEKDIEDVVSVAQAFKLNGIIATNTTIMPEQGEGGVSGRLLTNKARKVRERVLMLTKENPDIDVIGVGGISCFDDLWDFWKAGGRVCQIYTSFIYQGPKILKDIANSLDDIMKKNKVSSLRELLANIGKMEK